MLMSLSFARNKGGGNDLQDKLISEYWVADKNTRNMFKKKKSINKSVPNCQMSVNYFNYHQNAKSSACVKVLVEK